MKTKFKSKLLSVLLVLVMVLALVPVSALTAFAAERADRDIVAVDSGNSFNMRLSAGGVLTWDEVTGATGYKVALLNSMGQSIWEWDNDLTNNNRVLPFIVEMDNIKYDSGRYTIEVIAKDTNKKASMSYYYTSNVDKLEEPHNLKWVGNNAAWEYVDGAVKYTVSIYDFEGVVETKTVTECPVDLSEYNPQNGWTFTVRAETNGDLNDKRNSNAAESPKKGDDTRFINLVDSGNALNMKVGESGVLKWDEVIGATGYQVVLKNPIGVEIYRWDNDFTNNYRMLPIITEMDNLKIDSGHYRFEVEPKGAGSVAVIANYYYTSHVEQFEAPYNLKWNGSTATWTAVNGASSYDVTLYDFNGQVKTVTVTDDWYDFSEYNPQDGWTFKVQAEGDGKSTAKRSSNATESPAKTTSYNLTVVAYGMGNTTNTGKVSMETEKGSQDFSAAVGGTFIKNTEVTVKAEANPGYEFVAWRVTAPENPEATLSTDATHTFKLENNLQLFAVFRTIPTKYSVAYHGNGATGGMTGDTVDAGGTCILKNCTYYTPYGKKFAGWAIGSADATPLKQPGDEITINADTTIYAVWENLYFTTQPTNTSGKIGTDVKLSVKIDTSQVPDEDTPYIVLEVKNGENWERVAEAKRSEWNVYNEGFAVQQNSACTKEYRYKIYNGTEWIESDTFTVEFLPIIVNFVDNTHSTITEPIEVDTVGGKISKPENPTYSGDTFYGWGWPYWDFESQTVTQDITLSAQWAGRGYYGDIPDVYALVNAKARIDLSNVNDNNQTYIYKYDGANWNQVVNVTNYGYYDLPASDVAKIETYKIVIKHSKDIESNEFTVNWVDDLFIVSFNANSGTGTMNNVNFAGIYDLPVCEFEAPNGKRFAGWAIGSADALPIRLAGEKISISANTTIYAIWEEIPEYMIVYSINGGEGSNDLDYAEEGSQITLATPQSLNFIAPDGKQFAGWAVGSVDALPLKQPGLNITINADTYIYAIWEVIPHECVGLIESGQGATCTVDGWKDYYVCECGKYYADENCQTPINDLEAWKVGAGKITAAHSGTPEWTKTATTHESKYTCCGDAVVAEEVHEWNNGTCSECGYVCLHTSVAVTKKDGQGATCTVDGYKDYYQCACGKYFADEARTTPISDLETWKANDGKILAKHEYGNLIPEESAVHTQTELKAGMHAHYYCSVCETYFDENKVETTENALIIPAPQHSYGDWVKDNEKHWKVCSCGLKSSENTHQYDDNSDMICNDCGWDRTVQHTHGNGTKQDGQGATCTVNGWKDYYKCSCGKLYTEAACTNEITSFEEWKNGDGKIEAGHSYGDLIEQVNATCSATGKQAHYHCSVCGTFFNANQEVKTENELTIAIDANAHAYGAWTSNGDGTHTRVCSLNGEHKETADCSGGTATCTEKAICEHCNTAYGDTAQHNHGTTWESDANEHWNECACGDKANKAAHTDSNNDGKCDTCEYQMSTTPDNPNNTPDNPNNTPDDPSDDKDGLGAGAIVGIVIGSVAVVGIGGFALFWFVIKKKSFADLIAVFKKK